MTSIRAKLLALIGVAVSAVAFLSAAAFYGLGEGAFWLHEVGGNRMPSTQSLRQMKTALIDARLSLIEAAIWENDTHAQDKFTELIRRRNAAYESYAREVAHYYPLPQTPEESINWQQFQREIGLYRQEEARLVNVIEQLAANTDARKQRELFVGLYRVYDAMLPLYRTADSSLQKVIAINDQEANHALKQSDASAAAVRRSVALCALLAVILVLVLGWYVFRTTVRQLGGEPREAADLVRKIARGDLRSVVELATGDTDSLMADVATLMRRTETLAACADAIGKGDFAVDVPVLSEHDRLGRSICDMSRMLRENRWREERRNWQKDGLAQLGASMSGDFDPPTLADIAINLIARYSGAVRGVLYQFHEDRAQLELIGRFMDGTTDNTRALGHCALGEGAVGQVARDRRPLALKVASSAAPENPAQASAAATLIVTGTTETLAGFTYTYPLLHEQELQGVIELASIERFDDQRLEYLAGIVGMLGSRLFVTRQRSYIRALLGAAEASEREARQQSEMLGQANARLEEQQQTLQQQAEELQQSNAQMEEQQQQLQQQTEALQQSNAQMEEQQQQLEQQNQALLASRHALDTRAQQLEQTSRYKSEFLANMSHELRTPLNSIILLSKMLGEPDGHEADSGGRRAEEIARWAQIIHRSGKDLLRLINDVLDLSKVEAGHIELRPARVNSAALIDEMNEMFVHLAHDRGLRFVIEDSLRGEFVSDPDKLSQILRNLLANAFKFTRQGEVSLRIARHDDAQFPVRISVRDSGIGIAPDKQALIFDAFTQADGSTSREFGGTGLGLTISLRFARLLGGTLGVNSAPGEGSEFILQLPLDVSVRAPDRASHLAPSALPAALPATTPAAAPATADARAACPDDRLSLVADDRVILLIDDDEILGETLMAINRRRGYKTLRAKDGQSGLALVRQYRPLGILLDLGLPDMKGAEVLHQLKSDPALASIPVYIVSASDRDEALMHQGALGYLQKPADESQLAAAELALLAAIGRAADGAADKPQIRRILVVENGSIDAAEVARIVGGQELEVRALSAQQVLGGGFAGLPVRLAIIDLGDAPVKQSLEIATTLRATNAALALVFFTARAPVAADEISLRRFSDSVIVRTPQVERRLLENIERFLREVPLPRFDDGGGGTLRKTDEIVVKSLSGRHILIADDDLRNLFVMTAALERNGARVSSVVNGLQALEFLDSGRVDLVIMDIMMPEQNGYDSIVAIRARPDLAMIPVVAVTAKAMPEDRQSILQAGADDYLSKPIDYDVLLATVLKWCAGRGI